MAKVQELTIKATRSDIGKKVLVFKGPGEDPILGIIHSVDDLTGRIIAVVVKDEAKREKILEVKDSIVQRIDQLYDYLPFLINLFNVVKSFFKNLFGKKKSA